MIRCVYNISCPNGPTPVLAPSLQRTDEEINDSIEFGRLQNRPDERDKVALRTSVALHLVSFDQYLLRSEGQGPPKA